ncbi:MAG: hypothetical protein ACUVT2_02560, partial [Thiobacillaceae bacterium]
MRRAYMSEIQQELPAASTTEQAQPDSPAQGQQVEAASP